MLLFLDFDGVLHPNSLDVELFCRIELLWKILQACPEVRVVFSTSWRESHSFDKMVQLVTKGGGEDLVPRFIGETPFFAAPGHYPRRDIEIRRWLDFNDYTCPWLAIDDMPEMFNGGHPNLYVVAGDTGLTDTDVLAILRRISPHMSAPLCRVSD